MWTLIVFWAAAAYNIGGFTSEEACQAARSAIYRQWTAKEAGMYAAPRTACIKVE